MVCSQRVAMVTKTVASSQDLRLGAVEKMDPLSYEVYCFVYEPVTKIGHHRETENCAFDHELTDCGLVALTVRLLDALSYSCRSLILISD